MGWGGWGAAWGRKRLPEDLASPSKVAGSNRSKDPDNLCTPPAPAAPPAPSTVPAPSPAAPASRFGKSRCCDASIGMYVTLPPPPVALRPRSQSPLSCLQGKSAATRRLPTHTARLQRVVISRQSAARGRDTACPRRSPHLTRREVGPSLVACAAAGAPARGAAVHLPYKEAGAIARGAAVHLPYKVRCHLRPTD